MDRFPVSRKGDGAACSLWCGVPLIPMMKFIKSIKPELALASLFAILSLIAIIAGQYGRNGYFTIAAAAFALATYVTYPPSWAIALSKIIAGKGNDDK